MPLSYSGPAVAITLKIIESYGIDPLPLMQELAIDPKIVADPNGRFRYTQIDQLWLRAAEIADDPAFGLRSADYWHPSQLGALGYGWLTSPTLRAAMMKLARYMRILTEGAVLDLEETNDDLSAVLSYKSISMQQPTRTDSFMAMLLAMTRANAGKAFHPKSVSLTHDAPADTGPFYKLLQCPVHFAASDNRFTISREDAERRLPSANPELDRLHDRLMIDYVARLDKNAITERVKAEIIQQLPHGRISDSNIAKGLFMNVRTLQRRLRDEGTTFQNLLTEVRRELAHQYLRDSRLSLNEISYLLGFSEMSSFSRAFKRWTGETPGSYRHNRQPS